MRKGGLLTIYHLTRKSGKALFLHGFERSMSTLSIQDDDTIRGRYGAEPRVEALTVLRNELYRRVESDVRDWVYEQRFVPRFLLSSVGFVVTYLFLSLVIRDPIPFVDEFVGASVVGVVAYVFLGRRYEQSKGASERRADLRSKIDGITFEESHFVHEVEGLFHQIEARPVHELSGEDSGIAAALSKIVHEHRDDTSSLLELLQSRLVNRAERRAFAELRRGSLSSKTIGIANRAELDLPLVALAAALEHAAG